MRKKTKRKKESNGAGRKKRVGCAKLEQICDVSAPPASCPPLFENGEVISQGKSLFLSASGHLVCEMWKLSPRGGPRTWSKPIHTFIPLVAVIGSGIGT